MYTNEYQMYNYVSRKCKSDVNIWIMLHDSVVFFAVVGDCKILFKFHYISSAFWSNFRITSHIIFMCPMAFKNEV